MGSFKGIGCKNSISDLMVVRQDIFNAITAEGFSSGVVDMINDYSEEIENGQTNFPRFNLEEHAGLCKAGAALIGASIIADYARASITASGNVAGGQTGSPSNWQIDERQTNLYRLHC